METGSIRTCDHCGEELPSSLRSDARFCNSSCRAEHSRQAKDESVAGRVWVKGHYRERKPRSAARTRRKAPDPTLTMLCAALVLQGAHTRSEAA